MVQKKSMIQKYRGILLLKNPSEIRLNYSGAKNWHFVFHSVTLLFLKIRLEETIQNNYLVFYSYSSQLEPFQHLCLMTTTEK